MPNLDVTRGDKSDFYFVEARDPEDGVSKIIEIVKNRLPKRFGFDSIKDVQVLCPMNRGLDSHFNPDFPDGLPI